MKVVIIMLNILSDFFQKRKVSKDLKKRQESYDKELQTYKDDVRSAKNSCHGLTGTHLEVMQSCVRSAERDLDNFLAGNQRPT